MYTLNLSDRRKPSRVVELKDVITISKLYFFEAITSQRKHTHTHEMFQCFSNRDKGIMDNILITDLKNDYSLYDNVYIIAMKYYKT